MKATITIQSLASEPLNACQADVLQKPHPGAYSVTVSGDGPLRGSTTACLDHLGYSIGSLGQQLADNLLDAR